MHWNFFKQRLYFLLLFKDLEHLNNTRDFMNSNGVKTLSNYIELKHLEKFL